MAGTLVANTINTDTGLFSTNNAYSGIAKAWVMYGVSGTTPTITQSFNVSSVTYVSTGVFTVTFATAMPNANYAPIATASINSASNSVIYSWLFGNGYNAPSTTSFNISYLNQGQSLDNPKYASVAVFSS